MGDMARGESYDEAGASLKNAMLLWYERFTSDLRAVER